MLDAPHQDDHDALNSKNSDGIRADAVRACADGIGAQEQPARADAPVEGFDAEPCIDAATADFSQEDAAFREALFRRCVAVRAKAGLSDDALRFVNAAGDTTATVPDPAVDPRVKAADPGRFQQ